MDAKPQRFGRAFRPRTDENAPMDSKVIHQRYKSTGALAMSSAAGLKGGAQRMAFGDVSNVSRAISRDDSSIGGKNPVVTVDKSITLRTELKSGPLLRPAQRIQQSVGPQAAVDTTSSTTVKAVTTKQLASSSELAPLPLNARNPPVKRDTAIFKDPEIVDAELAVQPAGPVHQPTALDYVPHVDSHPSKEQSPPSMGIEEIGSKKMDDATGVPLQVKEADEIRVVPVSSDETVAERSDSTGNDQQQSYKEVPTIYTDELREVSQQEYNHRVIDQVIHEDDEQEVIKVPAVGAGGLPHISEANEIEEYWIDEEDEENFDEDGYTTARSFRSRGDNTTGGPTVVLFPKVNAKIRKELATAKQVVEVSRSVDEIEEESWDTTMVAEYGDEIFQYMRELEMKMIPNAHYMDNQTEIQWSMRSILMDWLVQVHHRFALLPETLFLSVNYVDRFLSCKIVSLGKLQLVGATALLIAAKYEEINCPSLQEIIYMVDGGYTMDEILKAERFMLSMLQFELGWPGPMSFLRRISKADDYDLETRTLAKYFLEVTIMDERFVGSPPSFLAAGAHCLARMMLRKGTWTWAHIYYSNYTYSQLRPLLTIMVDCCEDPKTHHVAVFDKYCDRRYKRASLFTETEMEKGFTLPEASAAHVAHTSAFLESYQAFGLIDDALNTRIESGAVLD